MHNRIAAAVLLALLGSIAGTDGTFAQSAPGQSPPPYTAGPGPVTPYAFPPMLQPQPTIAQPTITRTQPRVHIRTAHRKHRVVRREPPPNARAMAERLGFKAVSDLVNFPKFFPGLGIIYVKPDSLMPGPFLCFDRKDRLVATVYMVPIKDMDDHKTFDGTAPAFAGKVDHVTIYYNPGHPGMDMPHYHIVLWHVTKDQEQRVAE
jgi:hypothetical protein